MRRFLLSLVLAFAVAGPGITWVASAEAADATVTLTDRANPATLTVAPGTRVTFANQSGDRKRIRSEDGPAEFDSGNLEAGAAWSVVLDAAGTYPYVDDRDRDDPAYHGTITVSPAAQPGGGSPNSPVPGQPPAGSPAPSAPATASVAILDRSFSPTTVTVAPGGTVSWTNQSDRDHTVTGTGFDSGILGGGGRFSHTFPSAGTFAYICELHSEMRASVTVAGGAGPAQPGPSPTATAPGPAPAAPAAAPATPRPQAPPAAGAAGATRHNVAVVDYAFRPAGISARVGDSVVWTNQGRAPHTATAAGAFDTGMFRSGEQRTTMLRTPGTFAFACTIHPEMTGVVTVAAAAGGPAPAPSPGPVTAPDPSASSAGPTSTTAPPAPAGAATPETAEVSVIDLAFEPATVRLAVGGMVTWRHNGIAPHTVTAEDSSFDSGLLQSGGSFSHRFDRTGTFQYICAFHPQMAGTVEIVDGSSAPAPDLEVGKGEQAAASVSDADEGSSPSGTAVLAALVGGAALLAGTGALLYGGSRMLAAGDRP